MFKRWIASLSMFVLAMIGTVGLTATPGSAAYGDCASARVCLFGSTGYGGAPFQVTTGYIKTLPGDCLVLTASYNNWASSVVDKTSHIGGERIVFFDLAGGGTSLFASTSNGINGSGSFSDSNLSINAPVANADNRVSSICVFV